MHRNNVLLHTFANQKGYSVNRKNCVNEKFDLRAHWERNATDEHGRKINMLTSPCLGYHYLLQLREVQQFPVQKL